MSYNPSHSEDRRNRLQFCFTPGRPFGSLEIFREKPRKGYPLCIHSRFLAIDDTDGKSGDDPRRSHRPVIIDFDVDRALLHCCPAASFFASSQNIDRIFTGDDTVCIPLLRGVDDQQHSHKTDSCTISANGGAEIHQIFAPLLHLLPDLIRLGNSP